MDTYIGYLTTTIDVTQRSAETIGEAFKTVFSRLGNVKVGKFTASQEDMASEDYNEENYENLNDIETVLDSIGIKLRENATTYKDTEEVLQEIADIWDTIDDVTKNAITTALAGTRQREIVLTLFENWDSVENFARISADSYGTAEEKMLAFTDSIEAAQNRVTDAVDQWALWANGAEAMKDFYNILAYVIRNLDTFGITIGGLLLALNAKNVLNTVAGGIGKAGSATIGFTNKIDNFMSNLSTKGIGTTMADTIYGALETSYLESVQEKYANALMKATESLNKENQARAVNLTKLLMEGDETDNLLANMVRENEILIQKVKVDGQYVTRLVTADGSIKKLLTVEEQQRLAKILQNTTTDKQMQEALKNIATSKNLNLSQEQLTTMANALKEAYKNEILELSTGTSGAYRSETANGNWKKGLGAGLATGAGTIISSMQGAYLGNKIGSAFGEDGQIAGTMIGSVLADTAAPVLAKGLGKLLPSLLGKVGLSGAGAVLGTALGGPFGAALLMILPTIGTVIYDVINAQSKQALEDAANEFQEESDKYSSYTNQLNNVTTFDKYIEGVDRLGRNVSLTDDEYQKWLDSSNALAEVFPELVQYTDEQGNKIVGLNGSVASLTDTLNEYINAQQRVADQALLDDTLFKSNYENAKSQYDSAKEQLDMAQKTKDLLENTRADYYNENSLTASYKTDANSNQIQKMINAINAAEIEGVYAYYDSNSPDHFQVQGTINQINEAFEKAKEALDNNIVDFSTKADDATGLLSDEVSTIFREMEYDSEYSELFKGMTDEVKQALQLAMSNFAPDENNIDDFRDSVENTIQQLGEYFKNNPEDITIAISPDTSMDAMDFQAARQEFLQNMINAFGGNVETLTDEQIKIICEFGFIWDGETKTFTDAYDSMQQIFDQKLYTKVEGGMGEIEKLPFTVNEAAKAYQLLNNAAEDALFTSKELFDRVVTSEYLDSSLSELARQYKNFAEYSDELTDSEKIRFNLIKKNLDAWSDRLGEVSGDYDSIIAKIEQIGDLDYSNITPEDFQSQYTDYEDLYSYLVNDFEGAWDIDMLNKVYSNSDLIPFIGDPEAMKAKLKGFLDDAENEYGYVWGSVLATSEEGTDALLKENADLVEKFKENYGIDLNNFDTLSDAKNTIDAYTTALVEGNWESVLNNLGILYAEDLAKFGTAQEKKIAMLGAVLAQMGVVEDVSAGYSQATADILKEVGNNGGSEAFNKAYHENLDKGMDSKTALEEARKVYNQYKEQAIETVSGQYNSEYINQLYEQNLKQIESMMPDLSEIAHMDVPTTGFSNKAAAEADKGSSSGSGSGDDEIESAKKYLEELQNLQSLINKEWEDMVAFANNTDSAYYGKMRENLIAQLNEVNRLLENYDEYLAAGMLEESDYNDLMQQRIDLQVELNNLDDEQVQEAIDLLETQDASIVSLIEAQKQLVATSDTYEELVERQQELNNLLEQQRELQRDVYEFERDMAEMATEYVSGTAYSNSKIYEAMMSLQKQSVEQQMESLLDSYNTVIAQKMQQYSSEGLSAGEAYNMAYDSEEARDLIQQYWELFQEYGDLVYQEFEDKVNELDGLIEDIESTKPQEWGNMSDIAPYYETLIGYIEKKVEQIEKALQNVDGLTDEQIQDLISSYNDAVDALQEAAQSQLEDTISYQESEFDALIDWLEEYKQSIEDIDLDEVYDPLIDDAEEALDDGSDILELMENLKKVSQERTRVYREGIGWVKCIAHD